MIFWGFSKPTASRTSVRSAREPRRFRRRRGLALVLLGWVVFWSAGGTTLIASTPVRVLALSLEAQIQCREDKPEILPGTSALQVATWPIQTTEERRLLRAEGFTPDRRALEFELRGSTLWLSLAGAGYRGFAFEIGEVDLSQVQCGGSLLQLRPYRLVLPVEPAPGLRMELHRAWELDCSPELQGDVLGQEDSLRMLWRRGFKDSLKLSYGRKGVLLLQVADRLFEDWWSCRQAEERAGG